LIFRRISRPIRKPNPKQEFLTVHTLPMNAVPSAPDSTLLQNCAVLTTVTELCCSGVWEEKKDALSVIAFKTHKPTFLKRQQHLSSLNGEPCATPYLYVSSTKEERVCTTIIGSLCADTNKYCIVSMQYLPIKRRFFQ